MSKFKPHSSPSLVKEPWLAVNLSLFLPGIGQLYVGKILRGHSLIFSQIILYSLSGWLILSPLGNMVIGELLLMTAFALSIWGIFDTYDCAKKANPQCFEQLRMGEKDPWFAVFLSRLIPGAGHLYLNRLWLSILFFTFFVISLLVKLVPILLKAFIFYHVYTLSNVQRKTHQITILYMALISILFSIIISLQLFWIKTYIVDTHVIVNQDMTPILQPADQVLVNKQIYRFSSPQRGDIVLFSPPMSLQEKYFPEAFTQRIIGLPGERVEIQAGKVYINSQPLDEQYAQGVAQSSFSAITVADNSYFVLGDNHKHSYDSQDWGLLPRQNIIGKVIKRFFPLQRIGIVY